MVTYTRRVKSAAPKVDPYQLITDQIIELLDSGVAPWHKPWNSETGMPLSMSTGKAYRGVNVFILAMESALKGYTSPWWGTFNQIKARCGVAKDDKWDGLTGQKSTMIVFWKMIIVTDKETQQTRPHPMLRTFRVFNADQVKESERVKLGLPEKVERPSLPERIADCDSAVTQYIASGPSLSVGGDAAYYVPSIDHVQIPDMATFIGSEEYYGTLFHELTHSTGHESRLKRPGIADLPAGHKFGDALYSKEELVAEMGSAFLSGMTGIAAVTLPNSAAYLQHWIRVLRGDKKLLIHAAANAQKAADLILGVTHEEKTED